MDHSHIGMVIGLLGLVAMSAYFSATETAFTSLNRIRLKTRADMGDKRAAKTLVLAEQYDKLLSTILIGNNIVNNIATTLGAVLFIYLLGQEKGPAVSAAVLTIVILVFGEVTPKSLAKESPETTAVFAAPLLRLLMVLLAPANFLFAQWKRLLNRLFHSRQAQGITEEELVGLVEQAETEGGLEKHESQLIQAAIEFNDLEAIEILTPRVNLSAVEEKDSPEKVAAVFRESGHSRLPVYRERLDNIIGILHQKDFYAAREEGEVVISSLMSPVHYTLGSVKISQLLRTLQSQKAHMAVVVDEYGGTEGIVTLEDILEELVGEIWDEHDQVVQTIQKQPDGSFCIAGSVPLSDLFELFAIEPETESDTATVAGFVTETAGRLPLEGESFSACGLSFTVTRMGHRCVDEIQVRQLEKEGESDSAKS